MAKLIATRGLPGSGKSTRAKEWVDEAPEQRARVNRDDIREMLHGGWLGSDFQEDQVSFVAHNAIAMLLRNEVDVICDDTNLYDRHVEALRLIAQTAGAEFEVWDMTDVPLDVCIQRDVLRGLAGGRYVGEKVIRRMYDGYERRHRTGEKR